MSTVAIGSIAAAGIGAAGALGASQTQAGASENAQQLQAQEAQNALNFQEQEYGQNQSNIKPFLQAGQNAVGTLGSLTNTPGQGLLTPWTQQFQAPTAEQAAQTPGYQFQLQQGENALQNSAAAQGNLLSGGTGEALEQYGQGLASENYQQVYNNALTQYQQSYNQFENNQANEYNRLAGLAGTGQTAAGQLGQTGQAAASNIGNISLGTAAQQGQSLQNAGAATASGYASLGNLLGGGVSTGANALSENALLSQLLGGGTNGVDYSGLASSTGLSGVAD
jgi:hypothetical protein